MLPGLDQCICSGVIRLVVVHGESACVDSAPAREIEGIQDAQTKGKKSYTLMPSLRSKQYIDRCHL